MGLTQKILLFTSLLIVALVATTLIFTTTQAERLANENLEKGLKDTRQVWETFQADRYAKLKLGIRTLANDPHFKALVQTGEAPSVLDTLQERIKDLGADFFIATDRNGMVIARTDRPDGGKGQDLSKATVVMKPLEGEESSTVWRQGDKLFHAVSVPMQIGPEIVGVLIAGYGINEGLAKDIKGLTHSEIAYLTHGQGEPSQLSVSSLGPREAAFKAALARPEFAAGAASMEPFTIDLAGEKYRGVHVSLKSASSEAVGSVIALRSVSAEMASFVRFRNSLITVSVVVMLIGLALAYVAASRITGPVRTLVGLVERARDGKYSGAVSVATSDEIGTLARTFNSLLADLREKEQLIGFLKEGMTMMKKGAAGVMGGTSGTSVTGGETASLGAVGGGAQVKMDRGALFANRYEVRDSVGKGGMGIVYRAQDRQLDEIVALKVLRPDVLKEDPTLLERFKAETKLARRITHRNVLRTHDFGEADGTAYISMEFLEGVTLKDLIKSKGALPLGVGLRIAKQMCQGLDAAHRQGVVHRDIKPQNMLIMPETGELKIMDFGIARVSEMKAGAAGLTSTGTVMGTPDYMPPEQAQGHPADFRSDIYSLGVVLFETFSGRLPFSGDTVMAIVLKHIQEPPPPLRTVNPRLPEDLEALVARCLDKDPDHRYQKMAEILKDLQGVSAQAEAPAA